MIWIAIAKHRLFTGTSSFSSWSTSHSQVAEYVMMHIWLGQEEKTVQVHSQDVQFFGDVRT